MTPLKPGPKPRDPSTHRTVIVRVGLTPDEAARLDAVRGDTDRAVLARDAVLREVKRREVGLARAAKVARDAVVVRAWESHPYGKCRDFAGGRLAAFADSRGWEVYDKTSSRTAHGPETGPEGRLLADAALRAAGYVLEGETP